MATPSLEQISPENPFQYHFATVLDAKLAYIDTSPLTAGSTTNVSSPKETVLFLHGNPTSSYLWRNIIPHISSRPWTRCIAPDLVGMGLSEKVPGCDYRFVDHARYLDAFISKVLPHGKVILVVHDWGSALGFHWARRNESRVKGIAFMEIIRPMESWDEWPEESRPFFQVFRTEQEGRKLLIDENAFIEQILPLSVARGLTQQEMDVYRKPFLVKESRELVYRWPNELPMEGKPEDVWAIAQKYWKWLVECDVSKLLFWAEPGGLVSEALVRRWEGEGGMKNLRTVGIGKGVHYLQEDRPGLIGRELTGWMGEL